ncbi:MAG: indolepyruvate ferredoxin oxidoreductase, partial [Bacteroidales bacterium]|nr:indolepyruvate ferredoxin oxidoreductase [Bacteroidales bacterium]
MVPCLEPSNQQEAYDMVRFAFDYSEMYHTPVLMRLTTRMAHSRAVVKTGEMRDENPLRFPEDQKRWVLLPAVARVRNEQIIKQYAQYEEDSEKGNVLSGPKAEMGVIACGIGWNYLMENIDGDPEFPTLKVTRYPVSKKQVRELASMCKTILVVEEGQPLLEKALRGYLPVYNEIKGRLDGTLPRTGELTPDALRKALGMDDKQTCAKSDVAVPRPPALCMGCGHRDFYTALNNVVKDYPTARVFSDIGCYTLGYLAPFHAINSCVDMGASITMAIGASESGVHPSIAVIGDSTFTHSGMTGLLDAVNMGANITVCISDNLTTGMTGGQDSAAFGRIENICLGIGVPKEHVRLIIPLPKNYEEMQKVIREEIEYRGVSVVVCRRECIQTAKRHLKKQ